jgi:pimeloyl-ACP methyl ester carboxylesterase
VARFHAVLDELQFSGPRFVMGRSLGSHPALEVAANAADRFHGLIIESGAASLRRIVSYMGGALSAEEAAALSDAHEAKIRSIRAPALIIHGERDDLVPIATAEELYALLAGADRDFVRIPHAGHNDLLYIGLDAYFGSIARFLRRNSA